MRDASLKWSLSPTHAVAFTLAMIASAVAAQSLLLSFTIGALGVLALRASRIPLSRAFYRGRATTLIMVVAVLLGILNRHEHPIRLAVSLAARMLSAAIWSTWLAATRSPHELDSALEHLGFPNTFVKLIAMTRGFGAQLRTTMRGAWTATALRGGFRTPKNTMSSIGGIAGLLLVRSFDRADRVKLALELRGGENSLFDRTRHFSVSAWFTLFAILGVISIADTHWGQQ
jgi:cobalt/nickel transport system permease protein